MTEASILGLALAIGVLAGAAVVLAREAISGRPASRAWPATRLDWTILATVGIVTASLAVLASSIALEHRYTTVSQPGGFYIHDNWFGNVRACAARQTNSCWPLEQDDRPPQ